MKNSSIVCMICARVYHDVISECRDRIYISLQRNINIRKIRSFSLHMFALRSKVLLSGSGLVRHAVRYGSASPPVQYPPHVKHYETLLEMQTSSCEQFKDLNFIGSWKDGKFDYVTYGKFGNEVDRFRTVLAQLGVGKDDKVAIISNNRLEWAIAYYAVNGRGAQMVPLYEAQTEKDWKFIIHNSDAKILLVATPAIYQKAASFLGPSFPNLQSIVVLDGHVPNALTYSSLMSGVEGLDIVPVSPVQADDLTAIVYTSGSTGNPKGVCLSHKSIITNLKGTSMCMNNISCQS